MKHFFDRHSVDLSILVGLFACWAFVGLFLLALDLP